jgi:hypothetical protein
MLMSKRVFLVGSLVATVLLGTLLARSLQNPTIRTVAEASLREYAGVYQWAPNAFLYLQLWPELTGTNQLVAFDENGEVRALYLTERDRFFAVLEQGSQLLSNRKLSFSGMLTAKSLR